MIEYLAFVDEIGRTIDDKYIYRFDFTVNKDIVWGNYFNITPSIIIPNLQPDNNTLSRSGRVIFPREMVIAKKNYCFSMQDCIDGIFPLIFSEIDENTLKYNDKPFYINFGEPFENVVKMLSDIGLSLTDLIEVPKGDDSAINELIDSVDNDEDDENNDDLDPDF